MKVSESEKEHDGWRQAMFLSVENESSGDEIDTVFKREVAVERNSEVEEV